jgi:hypothetical protein
MERDRPAGWLKANDVAAASGCSSARVRHLMRSGQLPAEMVHRVSLRGLWFNPEVVQVVVELSTPRKQ